ncbi:FtsK/SpoIIIE domain-containing protein [Catenulispora pinisilvae]|uniref:FtsK/SpoIIIE domain-containing protein n=1 Tax=Catenulispora pinisilvae TaxID=2705253 RepID=UPI001892244B|nr:FtsK/SpoIIIE domain-containing protein [Catenulispora pinisilvae]
MRIALTVHGLRDDSDAGTHAVLDAAPGSELADAAARLAALSLDEDMDGADAYVPTAVEIDGVRADRRALVGDTGLRDGSRVVLDSVAGTRPEDYGLTPEPALLEIRAVGGAAVGRTWRLGLGSHFAGSGPDCTVRWAGFPAEHIARLTVRPDGSVQVCVLDGADTENHHAGPIRVLRPVRSAQETEQLEQIAKQEKPKERKLREQLEKEEARDLAEASETGEFTVRVHDDFEIAGSVLRLSPPAEADADVRRSERGLGLDYNRPPRIVPPLPVERFRMPLIPSPPSRRPFPLITLLAPMVMGFAMVLVFHSYFYLIFTLFSPVFAITNVISDRRTGRKTHKSAMADYRRAKAQREKEITAAVEAERTARNQAGPDPATLGLIAVGPGTRLWERRRVDGDHLTARVGTAAVPALVVVDQPNSYQQTVPAWRVPAAPVSLDLAALGVTGLAGPIPAVRDLARWLLVQTGVLQSPRDVQIHLLADVETQPDWDWLRWLPHARFPEHHGSLVRVGNDPETVANRVAELGAVVAARMQARGSAITSVMFADPDVLVIVDGARRLRDVPGMVQILKDGPGVRVFFLCLDRREGLLPEECKGVVTLEDVARADGYYATVRQAGAPALPDVRADGVGAVWCDTVARAVAPIRDVTSEDTGALPDSVALLDLLGLEPPEAERIAAAWERRPASTAFVLGAGYDGPAVFDLVTDGPHSLIAGTTGSGKSELLQAMVAALATANRPDELVFVLVDYKGGSAFRDCVRLPHALGMVTDLDDHLVDRALTSLGAELRRREQVLAAAGAKDLPEYAAMRARNPELAPLPRLVIMVDEFATLAREVPQFVTGVVSISQRGRSLGLHLVLATQRPAGAVTADIRANTNLRISLRMTDGAESRDVIDSSDAAGISAATPGRALARLGQAMVVPFQTGYAGAARPVEDQEEADAPPPPTAAAAMPWQRLGRRLPPTALAGAGAGAGGSLADIGPTDLSELVDAIREAATLVDFEPGPSPWLAPLPTKLLLDELPQIRPLGQARHGTRLIPVSYALDDRPERQAQAPVVFNPDNDGHLYFIGSARSGRSQALRTLAGALARTVSTADLHMYGIDAGGGALSVLESLPHCGAVVQRTDRERIERLLTRLNAELARRQDLLTKHNAANLAELREALPPGELRPAHIAVFVDSWESLNTAIGEFDNGRLVDMITQLIREGAAAGLHMILSGDRALLNGKLASLNEDKFLLRMNDRSDYMLIGMGHAELPTVVPAGRGWRSQDCIEAQVAVLAPDLSGQAQAEALRRIGAAARDRDEGVPAAARPYPIAPLPSSLTFAEAWERMPAEPPRPLWALLGLSGDDVAPRGVDLAARGAVVLGPAGSGRSTALATMAVSLLASGTGLVVLTPRDSPLRRLAGQPRVQVVTAPQLLGPEITEALAEVGAPAAILIDDADLLLHTAADNTLRDLVATGRDQGVGMVAAGSAEAFVQAVIGWASELRRARTGVLLAPTSLAEGDCIGVRLPQDLVRRPVRYGRALTGDAESGRVMSLLIPHTELK